MARYGEGRRGIMPILALFGPGRRRAADPYPCRFYVQHRIDESARSIALRVSTAWRQLCLYIAPNFIKYALEAIQRRLRLGIDEKKAAVPAPTRGTHD